MVVFKGNMNLEKDMVTLVIGGSGSLGSVVVETLSKSHENLIFSYYKNEKKACEIESNFHCHKINLDLKDFASFEPIVKNIERDFAPIGNLIFCSSYNYGNEGSKFFETTLSMWDEANDVDVKGQYFFSQIVARAMAKRKIGKITFTGSVSAIKNLPSPSLFTMNKSAITGLMKSLSKELSQFNILVNSVDPGLLEGGISNSISDTIKNDYKTHSCLNRLGKFQEIANIINWIASNKNTYLVGQSVVADGGI